MRYSEDRSGVDNRLKTYEGSRSDARGFTLYQVEVAFPSRRAPVISVV